MEVSLGLGWLLISLHSSAPPLAAICGQQFGSSGGKWKVSCRNCHPCHISKASWSFTSWVAGWAKSCSGHFPCPWWACQWWLYAVLFLCLPSPVPPQLPGAAALPQGWPPPPPGYVLPFCLQQSRNEMLGERGEGRGAVVCASCMEVHASASLSQASAKEKKSKCEFLTASEVTVQ